MSDEYRVHFSDDEADAMLEHDAAMAKFATDRWIDSVAKVPIEEMAIMVAEDPSVMTALIGALRFARWQLSMRGNPSEIPNGSLGRAADLTSDEREALKFAITCVESSFEQLKRSIAGHGMSDAVKHVDALSLLDRLLGGNHAGE